MDISLDATPKDSKKRFPKLKGAQPYQTDISFESENPQSAEEKLINEIKISNQRLKKILTLDFSKATEKQGLTCPEKILLLYGISQKELEKMSFEEKHRAAIGLIGHDLLLTQMYRPNGEPTTFADLYYPDIKIENYELNHTYWLTVKEHLLARLKKHGQNYERQTALEYLGNLTPTSDDLDICQKYLDFFGPKSLVVIPYYLELSEKNLTIEYNSQWQPPYGGNTDSARLVFFPRADALL